MKTKTKPRLVRITFRVAPEVKEMLVRAAALSGMSLSKFVRTVVLRDALKTLTTDAGAAATLQNSDEAPRADEKT
jgi:uncharacterized protein (DUF1778 family)